MTSMQGMLGLPVGGARRRKREGGAPNRYRCRCLTPRPVHAYSLYRICCYWFHSASGFMQMLPLPCNNFVSWAKHFPLLCFFFEFFFFFLFRYCCCFSLVLAEHVWKFPMSCSSSSIASARDASTFLWTRAAAAAATKSCLHATCILKVGQDNYNLVRFKSDFSEVSRVSTQEETPTNRRDKQTNRSASLEKVIKFGTFIAASFSAEPLMSSNEKEASSSTRITIYKQTRRQCNVVWFSYVLVFKTACSYFKRCCGFWVSPQPESGL